MVAIAASLGALALVLFERRDLSSSTARTWSRAVAAGQPSEVRRIGCDFRPASRLAGG